jgi:hypothetical protein
MTSPALPIRKGQRPGCPSPVRELMALNRNEKPFPATGRQAIFLRATEPRPARPGKAPPRGDASRPSPVGGVNELVKYADVDLR